MAFLNRESPEQRAARREAEKAATMRVLACTRGRAAVMGGSTTGQPIPKAQAARTGKRTPTKDERAWMDAIVRYGCIACRIDGVLPRPTAVHHIVRGGVRLGHKFTLPLCDPGHHQGGDALGLVSRHPWKARFEQRYGSEDHLLAHLQAVLKLQPDGSYAL